MTTAACPWARDSLNDTYDELGARAAVPAVLGVSQRIVRFLFVVFKFAGLVVGFPYVSI